jgi:Pyridoxal-dependent decarboxylase conserved domain
MSVPGEQLWLHVDAAYGGFAALTEKGRTALAGIDRADSVTLDPHKWFYQPLECGSVLVRDGARLEQTFAIHTDYISPAPRTTLARSTSPTGACRCPGDFRALKVWVTVQTFGVAAFRAAIQRNLERSGAALVWSTRLAGRHAIRMRILNPASSEDHIRLVIEHFADAPTPLPRASVTETAGQVLAPPATCYETSRCCLAWPTRPSGPSETAPWWSR